MDPNRLVKEITPTPRLENTEYDLSKRWESFMRIAKKICLNFEISEENRKIYEESIKYFAGDPSCVYDLEKGLYIYGDTGVGKTHYFKIFSALNRAVDSPNRFKTFNVNDLIDGYSADGPKFWSESGINHIGSFSTRYPIHIFVDDLGQGSRLAWYYGNSIDTVNELIQRRYYSFTENYVLTHASSNIKPSEINKTYGKFIASRMREMFNIIHFPGTDKRK